MLPKKNTKIRIKIECIGLRAPITSVDAPNKKDIIKNIKDSKNTYG